MIIKNARVLQEDFQFRTADVRLENGKISEIGTFSGPPDIDLAGMMLWPGLVDIHTHGALGADVFDCSFDSLNTMSVFLARHGVTAFLAGTYTQTPEMIRDALVNIKNAASRGMDGAKLLGVNFEGLYINPEVCGAQRGELCGLPDPEQFADFQRSAEGMIRLVTVAPELKNAMTFIRQCGVRVSIGHTKADYVTVTAAFRAGALNTTHLYNAMTQLTHRAPDAVGAVFDSDEAFAEIICDGHHIHPAAVRIAFRQLGDSRLFLISDSVRAAGMPDGEYFFGGIDVSVKEGVARSRGGNLAGSTTNLFDCVKKAVEFGIPLESAVKMASATPCKLIGENCKGIIKPGFDADLLAVDNSLRLRRIFIGGREY